jgi:hypothetical protein
MDKTSLSAWTKTTQSGETNIKIRVDKISQSADISAIQREKTSQSS